MTEIATSASLSAKFNELGQKYRSFVMTIEDLIISGKMSEEESFNEIQNMMDYFEKQELVLRINHGFVPSADIPVAVVDDAATVGSCT